LVALRFVLRGFTFREISKHLNVVLGTFKLILEAFDLFSQLCNQFEFRINIEVGLVLNLRCLRRVVQCAEVLFSVSIAR
jgi:hypothetical protein